MALHVSPEDLAVYRRTARLRQQEEEQRRRARHEEAWRLARDAAELLKARYRISYVCLFGSLLDPERFNLWSDIDLAAWGLTTKNWLSASGGVRTLSDEIDINLVDVEACSEELRAAIERDGISL